MLHLWPLHLRLLHWWLLRLLHLRLLHLRLLHLRLLLYWLRNREHRVELERFCAKECQTEAVSGRRA